MGVCAVTYCYRRVDGVVVEREFPCGEAPKSVKCADGRMAVRDFHAEHMPHDADKGQHIAYANGLRSMAAGVHPSQIPEAMKQLGHTGVRFDPDGTAVFDSREIRNRHNEASGMRDLDGGYGDH